MSRFRPTVVEVDLDAVRHNVRALTPPGSQVMAVVKSDAYGHGAVPVAKAALDAGATWLGVALVEEGIALRDAGIDAPILVLSEFPPGSEKDALRDALLDAPILVLSEFPPGSEKDALASRLTPTVYSEAGVAAVAEAAKAVGRSTVVHLKVDTGMHRVGLWPPEAAPELARRIIDADLSIEGLWTHFASAESDDHTTREQLDRLLRAAEAVRAVGIEPTHLHAANSAATIRFPESHLDLVRPGAAIYGIAAGPGLDAGLRPALGWRSAVTMVKRLAAGERISYGQTYALERDATVATVPVGYGDGFPRLLSNRAEVLIRGARRRVAGTVTMDQIVVDCGDDAVAVGDDVVLLGQQGAERITAEELAGHIGTIGYEILCAISDRVPREHRG